ncbi:hypothetical protein [Allokutzneria albata]|uniref:ATP synthase protein I n=1 Tax=Allokutzneria albata TaxID=211114 RepID=A0A1G9XTK7_ALLAB|nr:hypothetical protein [Allokutzneria albata]SDN00138.1 hypothetical protein SAMN04489726_4403 [Allokutzneria albata]
MNPLKQTVVANPSEVLRRALVQSAVTLGALVVVSVAVAWSVAGEPGLWGAVLGAAIAGVFLLVTTGAVLATMKASPAATLGAVMGSWLVKMVAVFVLLLVLRPLDFYSKPTLFVVTALSIVVVLVTESLAVIKSRAPYVEPTPRTPSGQQIED